MRILLIDHPWLARALVTLGHDVFTCWSSKLNKMNSDYWDLIIKADTSQPFVSFDFLKFRGLKLFYSTDSHFHVDFQEIIGGCFDGVLVAQKHDLKRFQKFNPQSVWMPLAADVQPTGFKYIPASFVGNLRHFVYSERREFFDELSKRAPILISEGDWRSFYSRSFMVVNKSVRGDLNFRLFEGLSCGCLVLTHHADQGLEEIFEPGTHLVTYSSVDECAALIEHYLENHTEMIKIARTGHHYFIQEHSTIVRAKQILEFVNSIQPRVLSQADVEAANLANLCWWMSCFESLEDNIMVERIKVRLEKHLQDFKRFFNHDTDNFARVPLN